MMTGNRAASAASSPDHFSVLSLSRDVMLDQIGRSRLAGDPPHVMIHPRLSHRTILDFRRAEESIEEGYRAMKEGMGRLADML